MRAALLVIALLWSLNCFADDHHYHPAERKFKIDVKPERLHVEASYKNGTYEDSFKFDVELYHDDKEGVADFRFRYKTKNDGNKTELDFYVPFLVEFVSTAAHPYFDGTNQIVSQLPSHGQHSEWQPWVDSSAVVDGVQVYHYTATNGIVTVGIQMAQSSVSVDGLFIDPNSVKIDFEVNNYPYAAKNETTRLALESSIRSHSKVKTKGERAINDHRFHFDDATDLPLGVFSWVPTALAKSSKAAEAGSDIEVYAHVPQSGDDKDFPIYYTFMTADSLLHPGSIYWDPKLGLDYNDESGAFCIGSICGGAAIGVVVGLVALVVIGVLGTVLALSRRKGYQRVN